LRRLTATPVALPCSQNEADQKTVRGAVFPTNAIQFCLTIKVLFKLPLRQTIGMVASLLKMADLDWAVPDYTTLCRRQKTLAVLIPYPQRAGELIGGSILAERPAYVQDAFRRHHAQVPSGAEEMIRKIFGQLDEIQALGTDTRLAFDQLRKAHHEQAEKVARVEKMISEIHQRLMMTVAVD
jgi:hypothetical protein